MDVNENFNREDSRSSSRLKEVIKRAVTLILIVFILANISSIIVGITSDKEEESKLTETEGVVKVLLGAYSSNVTNTSTTNTSTYVSARDE